jgi:hypothetical protein
MPDLLMQTSDNASMRSQIDRIISTRQRVHDTPKIRMGSGETKMTPINSLHEVRPTSDQQLAMSAMLRNLLGEHDFERLCVGIKVGDINENVLQIFVPAENRAADIKLYYSDDFAVAAEYALGLPLRMVEIVAADLSTSVGDDR